MGRITEGWPKKMHLGTIRFERRGRFAKPGIGAFPAFRCPRRHPAARDQTRSRPQEGPPFPRTAQ